jgi:polysaccharide export outer membrane protein
MGYEDIRIDIKGAVRGQDGKDIHLKPEDIVVASEGIL